MQYHHLRRIPRMMLSLGWRPLPVTFVFSLDFDDTLLLFLLVSTNFFSGFLAEPWVD